MTNRSEEAVRLVEAGMSPATAAKVAGISRQAVASAIKARQPKSPKPKPERHCSECGATLAPEARAGTQTCSGKCRVARSRRVATERRAEARERINRDRAKLGLPPLG